MAVPDQVEGTSRTKAAGSPAHGWDLALMLSSRGWSELGTQSAKAAVHLLFTGPGTSEPESLCGAPDVPAGVTPARGLARPAARAQWYR